MIPGQYQSHGGSPEKTQHDKRRKRPKLMPSTYNETKKRKKAGKPFVTKVGFMKVWLI